MIDVHDRRRCVTIVVENHNIGDGDFCDEVATALEAYAAQIRRGEAGKVLGDGLELPSGTRLSVSAAY